MTGNSATDSALADLFHRFLPYYWRVIDEVPADVRLDMAICGYGSIFSACMDIPKRITNRRAAKNLNMELVSTQVWKQ